MYVKVILLLCLLIQVESKNLTRDNEEESSVIDIVKATLELLETVVDDALNLSLFTLNILESTINSAEEFILKIAEIEINQIGDEIFEKLDELKKDANTFVVDIIDCTEDRENDLKQLLVSFLNKTGECAVARIDEVRESLTAVVVDIHMINEEVQNITSKLDDCKNESDENACILKVLEDITKKITQLPKQVSDDIKEAEKKVAELEDYLFECEHDNINELEMISQEIYNGIVECVENKISSPPNVIHVL